YDFAEVRTALLLRCRKEESPNPVQGCRESRSLDPRVQPSTRLCEMVSTFGFLLILDSVQLAPLPKAPSTSGRVLGARLPIPSGAAQPFGVEPIVDHRSPQLFVEQTVLVPPAHLHHCLRD